MLGVEGVDQEVGGPRSAASRRARRRSISTPSSLRAQAARSARACGRAGADLAAAGGGRRRRRPGVQLVGEPAAGVLLWASSSRNASISGRSLVFSSSGSTARGTAPRPRRPAPRDRSGWRARGLVGHEPGQADPDGELGLLAGVERRASSWIVPDDLGARPGRQVAGVEGQAELVVDPAGQRPPAPVLVEELGGRGEVDRLDRLQRLPVEELLEAVAVELDLAAVPFGELAEVACP